MLKRTVRSVVISIRGMRPARQPSDRARCMEMNFCRAVDPCPDIILVLRQPLSLANTGESSDALAIDRRSLAFEGPVQPSRQRV